MNKSFFRRGFTLIELMIVIVILGVLMGTILPRITGMQDKAKDTATVSNVNTISLALEAYYNANNAYPSFVAASPWATCLWTHTTANPNLTSQALGAYIKGNAMPTPVLTMNPLFGLAAACSTPATAGYAYGQLLNGYIVAGTTISRNNFRFTDANVMGGGAESLTDQGAYAQGGTTVLDFYIATN